jgi:hypothetical protein
MVVGVITAETPGVVEAVLGGYLLANSTARSFTESFVLSVIEELLN